MSTGLKIFERFVLSLPYYPTPTGTSTSTLVNSPIERVFTHDDSKIFNIGLRPLYGIMWHARICLDQQAARLHATPF